MEKLTNSRMKAFRRCQRLHQILFYLGYRTLTEAETLTFGTLLHKGLEAWWLAFDVDRLAAALDAVQGEVDPLRRAIVEELLRGYHFRWEAADYEPIAVEAEFTAPLVNPATGQPSRTYEQGGKLDVVVIERSTGRKLLVEHKSSSEDIGVGSTYWRRLRMDSQISTYFDGALALGHVVEGCVYDIVGKPTIRPYKATPIESRKYTKAGALYANQRDADEAPEEFRARLRESIATEPDRYYQRGEVVRLEQELTDFRFDLWQLARGMREGELAGRFPRNPDGCSMYGRTCDFFDVCSGSASLDDETKFKRIEHVHPELAVASG